MTTARAERVVGVNKLRSGVPVIVLVEPADDGLDVAVAGRVFGERDKPWEATRPGALLITCVGEVGVPAPVVIGEGVVSYLGADFSGS